MKIRHSLLAVLALPAFASAQSKPITMPGAPLGVAWGFLYGCGDVPAEKFMPQIRQLGGGFSKIYLIWNQIEPKKGQYDWSAVDAYTKQLKTPEEGLVSVFASSLWATKKPSLILPGSVATNPDDYYRFIYDLVKHCHGKVRYWQNDSEPNNPVYWSATKEEFVEQLKVFYKAVKDADPKAQVVAGGYDGLFNPPGLPPMPMQQTGLTFFDYVMKNGSKAFDIFDIRLYGNIYTITGRVDYIRQQMKALGYEKPIIATEYGGPGLFEFPVNRKYVPLVITWSQSMATQGNSGEKQKNPIAEMYANISSLAPETQIFMQGCSPELQAKFYRIQSRDLVTRNLLALSAGVQKTLYWDLWNDATNRDDLMTLMYGKVMMMAYDGKKLTKRLPVADAFAQMMQHLSGVSSVDRITVEGHPNVFLFEVHRKRRGAAYVVWEQRDSFSGEDMPADVLELPLALNRARASDVFGNVVKVAVEKRGVSLPVSLTPVYIEASSMR